MPGGELVFTVDGPTATAAVPISLHEAGLRERQHLQEWVIAHPAVLGEGVKIVASEFGRWTGATGLPERDRLDVLGLDRDGRLVVVELKRDRAPDVVDMQALKYAALVSRFTRDQLDKVHSDFLEQRTGSAVSIEEASAELEEWATITEESLRLPRLLLMATEFPKTVTATVVFLHQQLGLDIRLVAFQAYRTASDVVVTLSQHYPPPEIEEFVLSPEVSEARRQQTERQTRQREANAVVRLVSAGALELGQPLEFRAPSEAIQHAVEDWLRESPPRGKATWQDDASRPLRWEADGAAYTPTGLAQLILEQGAGRTGAVQGPLYWATPDGKTLVDLARELGTPEEVPIEVHLERLAPGLRKVFEVLDAEIRGLGPDVSRRSRAKYLAYYATKKLADLLFHGDHLSLYIRGVDATAPDRDSIVVGGTDAYSHTQLRTIADVEPVMSLVRRVYKPPTG
jgi:predicted transport protein